MKDLIDKIAASDLPDDVKIKAMEGVFVNTCNQSNGDRRLLLKYLSGGYILLTLFTWFETPECHNFWENVESAIDE